MRPKFNTAIFIPSLRRIDSAHSFLHIYKTAQGSFFYINHPASLYQHQATLFCHLQSLFFFLPLRCIYLPSFLFIFCNRELDWFIYGSKLPPRLITQSIFLVRKTLMDDRTYAQRSTIFKVNNYGFILLCRSTFLNPHKK